MMTRSWKILPLAVIAAAPFLTAPTAPARADCGTTVEQGIYDPDTNTFTPGTAATDDDIRITCTESGIDGDDVITFDSSREANFPSVIGPGSYMVVNLNGPATAGTELTGRRTS